MSAGEWIERAGQAAATILGFGSAKQNRDFQERMSGTAHQREVRDLIAAGLNPILSAGGPGAAMGQGSMYIPESPTKGWQQSKLTGEMSRRAESEVENINKDTLKKEEEIMTLISQQGLNSASEARQAQEAKLTKEQIKAIAATIKKENSQARMNSAQAANLEADNYLKELDNEIYRTKFWGKALRYAEKVLPWTQGANRLIPQRKTYRYEFKDK